MNDIIAALYPGLGIELHLIHTRIVLNALTAALHVFFLAFELLLESGWVACGGAVLEAILVLADHELVTVYYQCALRENYIAGIGADFFGVINRDRIGLEVYRLVAVGLFGI